MVNIAKQAKAGFRGLVVTKEWILAPNGETYMAFAGTVTILNDEVAVGFRVKGNESNWIARITGASGMSINILGCQVRAIHALVDDVERAPRAPIFDVP
jgi:uncharacterized Fe-S cluster-containing radical SAM superfamily protein